MPDPVRRGRRRPPYAPPVKSERLYLTLAPSDVAYFKFILEGWDNLALLTVVDRFACVVRMLFSPDDRARVEDFLQRARRDLPQLRLRFDPKDAERLALSPEAR